MSMVESEVKQIVLGGGPFGPQEVKQLVSAIAEDFGQYRILRDSVSELEGREERSPAASVRLGVCQYLLGRYQLSINALKTGDGGALAHFYLARCYFALQRYDEAVAAYDAAAGAGYNSDDCTLGKAEAQRMSGDHDGALATLDSLSGAVEQTAELPLQARRHGGGPGRQLQRSRGPVRAGRRGRSQPRRRPVRPGHGKRPPRQRRHGARSVRALGRPVPDPHRHAVEPGRAVRRPPAVRSGPAVLPAHSGAVSRTMPGPGCS